MSGRFVFVRDLDPAAQRACAQRTREVLSPFYDLFDLPPHRLEEALGAQFADDASELGQARARLDDRGELLGFYATYPLAEAGARQQASLVALARLTPRTDIFARVRLYRAGLPPLEDRDALYLARIHGIGAGSLLLAGVEADAGAIGASAVALHVHRDNLRARAFYAREGFVETDAGLAFTSFRKVL